MKHFTIIVLCGLVFLSCDIFTPEYDVVWRIKTEYGSGSSPAIAEDGTIYVCSHTSVYALDYEGDIKWEHPTESQNLSSPAIGSDGTIYVLSDFLYALNPDGSQKWKTEVLGFSWYGCPAIGPNGTIYCNGTGKIYAVSEEGEIQWEYQNAWDPVVGSDGTIYIDVEGDSCYELVALSSDGELQWSYPVEHQREGEPAVGEDGTIYFGTYVYDYNGEGEDTATFYAIDSDGILRWEYRMRGGFLGAPAIGTDGTIYVAANQVFERWIEHSIDTTYLIAFSPEGEILWKEPYDFFWTSTPAIGSDGVIYLGTRFDGLFAVNPDGSEKWRYDNRYMEGANFSSPAIGEDGTIYIAPGDRVIALQGSSSGLAVSSWPKYHHDNQNTGRVH